MERRMPEEVREWFGGHYLESIPANVIVVARDFRVVVANRNFVDVFGNAVGRYCYEVYKKRDSRCERCLAAATFQDGEPRVHNENGIDRHGRVAHFVVHTMPVTNGDGKVTHVIEMSLDVTETRMLQRQYGILFERAPCRISLLDRNLRVVRANEQAREVFGDRTGVPCYRLYKGTDEPCNDCPAVRTFEDGLTHTAQQSGVGKSGEPAMYHVTTSPLDSFGSEVEHVIEMSVDVTESIRLQRELLHEAVFRRNLTENALDALLAADASGVVTIFNPAAERLFGRPAGEVLGHRELWQRLPDAFLRLFSENGDSLLLPETTVVAAGGEEIPVRFSGTVLREEGAIVGGAAFLHDLRDVKRMEREKLENERLAAVGETVAQLAHGIKNVLTGLRGGMYALRTGIRRGSAERTERGWRALDRNFERITEMVKGFLSLSKGHEPRVEQTAPQEIVREVYQLYHDAAAQSGIELRLELADPPAPANLDREDLHTCLANLVSNAVDACQVADGDVHQITMRLREAEGALVFEVADSGCGMDYEVKKKVFTTFFSTKGTGGTGLGLLVTRKIVQEHGGRIEVESDPGHGSCFRIVLPRDRLPELTEPDQEHDSEGGSHDRKAAK
jgi:PAS domain S-box-containing protein